MFSQKSSIVVVRVGCKYTSELILSRSSLPEVFCKKGVLRNLAKFTGKNLCQSLFFTKKRLWYRCFPVNFYLRPATIFRSANLFKKRLWHRCFPVDFLKFLRTPFFIEYRRWLLLSFYNWFVINQLLLRNRYVFSTAGSSTGVRRGEIWKQSALHLINEKVNYILLAKLFWRRKWYLLYFL